MSLVLPAAWQNIHAERWTIQVRPAPAHALLNSPFNWILALSDVRMSFYGSEQAPLYVCIFSGSEPVFMTAHSAN